MGTIFLQPLPETPDLHSTCCAVRAGMSLSVSRSTSSEGEIPAGRLKNTPASFGNKRRCSGDGMAVPETRQIEDQIPLKDRGTGKPPDDTIPDELLATLNPRACPEGRLEPLRCIKTPRSFKITPRPDPLWHHPTRRTRYQHFLDQPISRTGAGRDISFLCEATTSHEHDAWTLAPRPQAANDVSSLETLIPSEYHIMQNKGLQGLNCYDDKFAVLLEDSEKKLRVFPSLRPSGRFEVKQLMKVMDSMLEKEGVGQEFPELTELSQMENLLNLVRTEQNIYNIVFHELIRQVSVECVERGQLLARLRQRYAALLDCVPRHLKGLHTRTLAQRALDHRLAEEILHIKRSDSKLQMELNLMREHDERVSKEAEEAKESLAKALEESQQHAQIVAEHYDMYEQRRKRLEGQIIHLTEERDLWKTNTYNLALRIIKMNTLDRVRQLSVSEQTWVRTADHLTLVLTSKDSEDVSSITELTGQWKEKLSTFVENLESAERHLQKTIQSVLTDVQKWHQLYEDKSSRNLKVERSLEEELSLDLMQLSNVLIEECDRYGGEDLASGQEMFELLSNLQESWTEVCLRIFRRHPTVNGRPPKGLEAMKELTNTITEHQKQLETRITGDSGILATLMSLIEIMEAWSRKLKRGRSEDQSLEDSVVLKEALGSLISLCEKAGQLVDSTQSGSDRARHNPHTKIQTDKVLKTMKEFVFSQENFFDCENMRLRDEVVNIHTTLIHWMSDLLLLLVPVLSDQSEGASQSLDVSVDVSAEKLEENARSITGKLDVFSKYISSSCQGIVDLSFQKNVARGGAENEQNQLARLQNACGEWMESCQVLLSELKGSPVDLQLSGKSVMNTASKAAAENVKNEPSPKPESSTEDEEEPLDMGEVEEYSEEPEHYSEKHADIETSDKYEVMKLFGHDGERNEKIPGENMVSLSGTEKLESSLGVEDAQEAFNAAEAVRSLQQELLDVEAQAISAESRALKAEEDLEEALSRIQELESKLQPRASVKTKVSKKKVTSVSKSSRKSTDAEAKTQNPRPDPTHKPSKGSKKAR